MAEPPPTDRFEQAKSHFLEGLDCHQRGDYPQAERHYLKSLELLPGRPSTLINLAATQLRLNRPADALASAERALVVEPQSIDALLHRATALARLGRAREALAGFQRLLSLDPAHSLAWSLSGGLLREMKRPDEAAHAYREALRHGADPDLHVFYLASVGADGAPRTAPRDYVQGLFDDYADEFDRHLVGQLNYQAHIRLVEGLGRIGGTAYAGALDLGCGTGLCGPLVRPLAARLTGIDLSAGMLDKAREIGVYDRLEQADIDAFVAGTNERFDLVLAADVFIYVGDLEPVFAGVRRIMECGMFCFSVEVEAADDLDFRLLPSLRYAHSRPYLQRLAASHGFDVLAMDSGVVRQDQRETVEGLFVYLRRGAAPVAR